MSLIDDKYEVLHRIKEGGMGAIYKVRHRLLDEIRVVKVMRPQASASEDLRRRFVREARMAIRVRHTNIGQLYDFSIDDEGTAVIVMEFIDGVTVGEILASGPPPTPGFTVDIAIQVLQALSCLHHNGIVHRDVASDNVMITRSFDGRPLVKVIDLGIAKDPAGDATATVSGMFIGKARYAAPEQFRGEGGHGPSPASDLYSFAVLLYEMLTGQLPVPGSSFAELAAGHLFQEPIPFARTDPDGRVPEGLRDVILRCLEKHPEDRIGSAEELAERLRPFGSSGGADPSELDALLARVRGPDAGEKPPEDPAAAVAAPARLPLLETPRARTVLDAVITPTLGEEEIELLDAVREHRLPPPSAAGAGASEPASPQGTVSTAAAPGPAGPTAPVSHPSGTAVPRRPAPPPAEARPPAPPVEEPAEPSGAEDEEEAAFAARPRRRRETEAPADRPRRPRPRREPRAADPPPARRGRELPRSLALWGAVAVVLLGIGGYAVWVGLRDPFADQIATVRAMPSDTGEAVADKLERVAALSALVPKDDPRRDDLERERERLTHLQELHRYLDRLAQLGATATAPGVDATRADRDARDAENLWALIRGYRQRFVAQDADAARIEQSAREALRRIAEVTGSERLGRLAGER